MRLVEADQQGDRRLVQDAAARVHLRDLKAIMGQPVRKCASLATRDSGDNQLIDCF